MNFDEFKFIMKSKFFKKNLLLLFIVMNIIHMSFAINQYNSSKKLIDQQITTLQRDMLNSIMQSTEECVAVAKYQSLVITKNSVANAVLNSNPNDPELLPNQQVRLNEYLSAIANTNSFIDSVCLYSDVSKMVFIPSGAVPVEDYEDTEWLKLLGTTDTNIYSRALNNSYPYVISIVTPMKLSNHDALIIINIDWNKIPAISNAMINKQHQFFIISDSGVVFCKRQQEEIAQISSFPLLNKFYSTEERSIVSFNDKMPIAYSSAISEFNGWQYVIITSLPEYSSQISSSMIHFIIMFILLMLFAFAISFYFSLRNYAPIHSIYRLLKTNTYKNDKFAPKNSPEIDNIAADIMHQLSLNHELSERLEKLLGVLKKTEFLALKSQFNPHFLFNTLNTINAMLIDELGFETPAVKTINSLSKLLRYSLDFSSMVPFETELQYTNLYINIMKSRYPNTLVIETDVDDSIMDCLIPKLLIQPMIENAVIHGYTQKNTLFRICISCKDTHDQFIHITVSDNGLGMDKNIISALQEIHEHENIIDNKKNTGIPYVILKLRALYNNSYTFNIESEPDHGTVINITFPKER